MKRELDPHKKVTWVLVDSDPDPHKKATWTLIKSDLDRMKSGVDRYKRWPGCV